MQKIQKTFLSIVRPAVFGVCLLAGSSYASSDDAVLNRITSSISLVYVSASECKGTLSPGPEQYVQQIDDYFTKLYPNGAGYWALPPTREMQTNREICIINLESSLLKYQRSLYEFRISYPKRIQPPMLLAYRWRDRTIENDTPTFSTLPISSPKASKPDSRF